MKAKKCFGYGAVLAFLVSIPPAAASDRFGWGSYGMTDSTLVGFNFKVRILIGQPTHGQQDEYIEAIKVTTRYRKPSGSADGSGLYDVTQWVDSLSCPALVARKVSLAKLAMPRPKRASDKPTNNIILDGGVWTIEEPVYFDGEKADAQVQLSGNDHTPIAAWVKDTETALKPCWQDTPPPN